MRSFPVNPIRLFVGSDERNAGIIGRKEIISIQDASLMRFRPEILKVLVQKRFDLTHIPLNYLLSFCRFLLVSSF